MVQTGLESWAGAEQTGPRSQWSQGWSLAEGDVITFAFGEGPLWLYQGGSGVERMPVDQLSTVA